MATITLDDTASDDARARALTLGQIQRADQTDAVIERVLDSHALLEAIATMADAIQLDARTDAISRVARSAAGILDQHVVTHLLTLRDAAGEQQHA